MRHRSAMDHSATLCRIFVPIIILILAGSTALLAEQLSDIKITLRDKQQLTEVRALHLDVVPLPGNQLEAYVKPNELSTLDKMGIDYQVVHPNIVDYYASRLDATRDMGGYRTLSEIYLVMDSIANAHPSIVSQRDSIGATIQGRPLYVMKISDNVNIDEPDEPEVYYYSAIHCREVITPEVLIYFMRYLTNNYGIDPEVTDLVNNRQLYFTLVVNPDGYYYNQITDPNGGGMWRKNRRNNGDGTYGVDLNRNFGFEWGYDDFGSSPSTSQEDYRGSGPFSEPESQSLRDFISAHNFVLTVSYHSHGDDLLYPWGYDQIYTPDQDIFASLADTVNAFNGYVTGTPWQVLYPVNGSTDDWGYGEQVTKNKCYSFSLEVGNSSDGFWPPISRIPALVQENLEPNLFYARIADNINKLRPPIAPTIYSVGAIATDSFTLAWNHEDVDNPAVSFEVWQLSDFSVGADDAETPANPDWAFSGFSQSTQYAISGTHSYYSQSGDNLNNSMTTAFPYTVQSGDSLEFMARWDMENNWDYGYVEVSADNGGSWSTIAGNITTTSNPNGNNLGNGITGSSDWTPAKFDLSNFVGHEILLRFRYVTDSYVTNPGLWIDDISPVVGFGSVSQLAAADTDTTYLVTGLTDGVYDYRVRARDAESQLSLFSSLVPVEVTLPPTCTWLVGDANNDQNYSVSDALVVINYIFGGGASPAPNAVGSGDADCNGAVTVADAVYIVSYIFGGGPTPGQSCSCTSY